ncbi:MAG: succinylglutamate desuccinylase/aspartoacylase family protein [Pseudomonadales bacterium]|nr:succinylglutamate desuccinylase/aspartoacylase family protein [Pseudomonadales bacterium]NRA17224.1 succinylglutamate desuccinylase/aspartoacylase family protein [Oceanospirillaceae bacterium]
MKLFPAATTFRCKLATIAFIGLGLSANPIAAEVISVDELCKKIGKKLSSVSVAECRKLEFDKPRFYSVNGLPLLEKHYWAKASKVYAPKILFIGGIHGDEYSSVSVTFKWLKTLDRYHSGSYDWHFLPLANPDGLLQKKSSRVNARNIDLNRNFLTDQEQISAIDHWQHKTKQRPRYYPGLSPLSEPESSAIHQLIAQIKPTVIVSVHAPHGILDFDGQVQPPSRLGPLRLRQLGTYPGSLGNYGYNIKDIPVMTIELQHAGIMPKRAQISAMWMDLVRWIKIKTKSKEIVALIEQQ